MESLGEHRTEGHQRHLVVPEQHPRMCQKDNTPVNSSYCGGGVSGYLAELLQIIPLKLNAFAAVEKCESLGAFLWGDLDGTTDQINFMWYKVNNFFDPLNRTASIWTSIRDASLTGVYRNVHGSVMTNMLDWDNRGPSIKANSFIVLRSVGATARGAHYEHEFICQYLL